ncbi:MAG TPA: hypothetical protein VGJ69_00480 [Pyrinomonadaceae bacterium]|jgi:hypothetical protein
MDKLKKLITLAFPIAVVLACSSLGQKWETINEDGITIEMPGKPNKQSQDIPTGTGKATGQMFTLDKGGEAYILAYHEFPATLTSLNIDPKVLLKGASDGAVKNIDGKVISQRDITSGPYPGTEIVGSGNKEGKDIEFTIRLYWAKPRLVQTLYLAEKGKTNKSNATKFLDSLKIS